MTKRRRKGLRGVESIVEGCEIDRNTRATVWNTGAGFCVYTSGWSGGAKKQIACGADRSAALKAMRDLCQK